MNTEPRWLNDEEQSLWRLLLAAQRRISRVLDETLISGSDLSTSEFSVLVSLSEADGQELRLRDLCAALEWDRSRTSHQVTRMEKRGLVIKRKVECDGRGVSVTLTEDGMRRLKQAAPEHVEVVRRVIFDHMSASEAEALRKFCSDVLDVNNVPGHPDYCGSIFPEESPKKKGPIAS